MMSNAPWPSGTFKDYKAFVVEIHIRRDNLGRIRTYRCLQSERDEAVVRSLPSGGVTEASWALLTEAVRSEMLLQLLVRLAAGEEAFQTTTEATMASLVNEFTNNVKVHMHTELDRILPGLVRDTLIEVQRQLGEDKNPQ